MRILIISDILPYPPDSGAALRIYNLLKRIAQKHDIWLVSLIRDAEEKQYVTPLLEFCQQVETFQLSNVGALARPGMLLSYLINGWPVDLRLYYSAEFVEEIQSLILKYQFDIVQIENSYMALYLETIPNILRSKTVLTLIDIDFIRQHRLFQVEQKLMRKLRLWTYSKMMRRWEPQYIGKFGYCITVSEIDRQLLLDLNPDLRLEVIANGVDTHQYQPLPEDRMGPALVFVGNMNYQPNVDAVSYFCHSILPHIRQQVPGVEFWIVGINPRPEVEQLAGDGIHVTGRVEDVRPYYERSTVCVVPLRAGGGTRLKIVEAMALGRCVVSTSVGAEGLNATHGRHLLIGDTPEEFANHVVQCLHNDALRQKIVRNARSFVIDHYDWDVIAAKLLHLYDSLVADRFDSVSSGQQKITQ